MVIVTINYVKTPYVETYLELLQTCETEFLQK